MSKNWKIAEILTILQEAKVLDDIDALVGEYSIVDSNSSFIKALAHFPENQLSQIKEFAEKMNVGVKLSDFVKCCKDIGALSVDPMLVYDDNGYPSIMLAWNRYLHLFRGYRYQVSYTEAGYGSFSEGYNRIDVLKRMLSVGEQCTDDLCRVFNYIAAIQACNICAEFSKVSDEQLDKFITVSLEKGFYLQSTDNSPCINDLRSWVKEISTLPVGNKLYYVPDNPGKGGDNRLCQFCFGEDNLSVYVQVNKLGCEHFYEFKIPERFITEVKDGFDREYLLKKIDNTDVKEMLLIFLLDYVGISMNTTCIWAKDKSVETLVSSENAIKYEKQGALDFCESVGEVRLCSAF